MTFIDSIILFGIMALLAALPSSSVALVVARSATLGPANGIAVGIGIVLGDLLFIALAIAGLSAVAEVLGSFFVVVKMIGGLYLIWLGVKLMTANSAPLQAPFSSNQPKSLVTSLMAGFALTLGDIKAILFYASLFPVFIDLAAIDIRDILLIVAITIIAVGGVKVAYALLGAKVASIARDHRFTGVYQKTIGGVMIGTGSYLIFKT
ncbi:LysE family translocator [Marinobacter sp. CHS3-4]|uniref:LysE family translocator n=1 Tax=Marinobacter sp. CHS3-4 TaxID=3045174 RepID=UPI0024B526F7|nr:LysE family translocator [Marinobacter sp. CHS3-4]MDI9243857.1 LysE family translocator [Marinobacter sp. CHS3-4]